MNSTRTQKVKSGPGLAMRTVLAPILILILSSPGNPAAQKTSDGVKQGEVKQVGLVPPETIPAYILKAVNSAQRPEAEKLMDAGRRPAQVLTFIGVAPGMKVADLF